MNEDNKLWHLLRTHRTWDDVVGNTVTVQELKIMIERKKTESLLFSGERGTGKTSMAKLFTKYYLGFEESFETMFSHGGSEVFNCDLGAKPEESYNLFRRQLDSYNYGLRVIIFDDAHRLTRKCQGLLAGFMNDHVRQRLILTAARPLKDEGLRDRFSPVFKMLLLDGPEERIALVNKAFQDERAAAKLGPLTEKKRQEFIAAIAVRSLNCPRKIYNALDRFSLGVESAADCIISAME